MKDNLFKSYLFVGYLLFGVCLANVCDLPQKYTYLSYHSLSKRDTLPDMFTNLSKILPKYSTYYQDGTQYNLTNIATTLHYNEHYQIQKPETQQAVRVVLGAMKWQLNFRYTIKSGSTTSTGTAVAQVSFDQGSYFIKQLVDIDGELEWNPTQISELLSTYLLQVVSSDPKLPLSNKQTIQKILSDNTNSTQKIKQKMLADINSKYKQILKQNLNKENLFPDRDISYSYVTPDKKNITLNFQCVHKNYNISGNATQGIQIPFLFGMKDDVTDCSKSPYVFLPAQFGGVQEAISMNVIEGAFKAVLRQGIYDVTLDRKWEVQFWQFFMGDLGNIISEANNYPADDPFQIKCQWDRNQSTILLRGYSDHEIYSQAGIQCNISYQGSDKISLSLPMSVIFRVITEKNYLNFQISRVFNNIVNYKSIDPKYVVSNEIFANQVVKGILNGMVGSQIVGSGWQTMFRRFPSSYVTDTYLLIFDLSQKN